MLNSKQILGLAIVGLAACSSQEPPAASRDPSDLAPAGDLVAEIGDAGHFEAHAAIEIRETTAGADVQLLVVGMMGRYGEFAFTVQMPPDRWSAFAAGGAVDDVRISVVYPLGGSAIARPIQDLTVEYFDDGTAGLTAQLGVAALPDGSEPEGAAQTTTFSARWSPRVVCSPLSPDPAAGADGLAGYDPALASEFCQSVIRDYHLERYTR